MSNKYSGVVEMGSKTTNIMKNNPIEQDFEPSMKTLLRILKTMTNNRSEGKTCLARDTNLNYARLAKHIVWLEKKGLVESVIDDQKINVVLTQKGRTFGTMIIN
ncbi:MAG TPA: winged helix-turn-helix domain-containing protein [Candidatus Nitrosotalea sp.]|nr:winged helix-turn-helix domain-containing protein [Candidatus Nitrosotalea sp.]